MLNRTIFFIPILGLVFIAGIVFGDHMAKRQDCSDGCYATEALPPQEVLIHISGDQPIDNVTVGDNIMRSMEVRNTDGQLSTMTFISKGIAFTRITDITEYNQINFWNDITVLKNTTDIRELHIYMSSGGGSVFSGLAMADNIEQAKRDGFKIEAHAQGIIASATVPVFAVCTERYATRGTIFMVHESRSFKFGFESASDIRAQNEMMALLRDRYMSRLVENSKLTKDEWENMEKETTWFSAEKALEWGLVDKIE